MNDIESLTKEVIDCTFQVHSQLGPGLLESTYEACLCHELSLRNIPFKRQVSLPVIYKETKLDAGYRLDLLIDDQLIIELKSVEQLENIHKAQLLTYLKLSQKTLGLLINFNSTLIKDGIKRVVLNNPNKPSLS